MPVIARGARVPKQDCGRPRSNSAARHRSPALTKATESRDREGGAANGAHHRRCASWRRRGGRRRGGFERGHGDGGSGSGRQSAAPCQQEASPTRQCVRAPQPTAPANTRVHLATPSRVFACFRRVLPHHAGPQACVFARWDACVCDCVRARGVSKRGVKRGAG